MKRAGTDRLENGKTRPRASFSSVLMRTCPRARTHKHLGKIHEGVFPVKCFLTGMDLAGPVGIEPTLSVLETDVLPLNYGPVVCAHDTRQSRRGKASVDVYRRATMTV